MESPKQRHQFSRCERAQEMALAGGSVFQYLRMGGHEHQHGGDAHTDHGGKGVDRAKDWYQRRDKQGPE